MKLDDSDIDVMVSGFPGKSVCHGSLGENLEETAVFQLTLPQ